jgi:hypothetical protein
MSYNSDHINPACRSGLYAQVSTVTVMGFGHIFGKDKIS